MNMFARTGMSAVALPLLLAIAGCARGNVDLLEGRLRQQEQILASMRSELQSTRNELSLTQQEANSLRSQLQGRGEQALLPEQARTLYQASGVSFNKLLTSGVDKDGRPGHELLNVVLAPHDADGELVKLPGTVELAVIDPSQPDQQQTLGRWQFDAEQCREHWYRGFIGSGYQFELPWQTPPQHRELVLHARFTTTDGREFTAQQLLEVEPPANAAVAGRTRVVPDPVDLPPSSIQPAESRYRPDPSQPQWQMPVQRLDDTQPVHTSDNWTDATIPVYR